MSKRIPIVGRTALVTGSSRGIGLLIAGELASRGCRVMLCACDEPALARAGAGLRGLPGAAAATSCDMTSAEAPGRLLAAVRDRFGAEVDLGRGRS
ncbi:SDR family NAD(P)-dependent oxidoreductase [Kitasatospora sp. NPDC049285]|uniref:SDR family NAD(P)-dependent oxidoreductase n=1 Tax=Kitasatospora sp. NPDC049285 TaxID=3157096 RepID=UPI00343F3E45